SRRAASPKRIAAPLRPSATMLASPDPTNIAEARPVDSFDDAAAVEPARRRSRLTGFLLRPEAGGVVSALLVFIFFAVAAGQNGFLTVLGTANWLDTASDLGIIALPVGKLMIGGEFDLSVGSVVGASSMIIAICS